MRALVTGGAGFIGSHVVDALVARGDEVVVLDDLSTGDRGRVPPSAAFVEGSVADPATVAGAIAGVEVVFHLGALGAVARSVDDPLASDRVNTRGTLSVLDAARVGGARRVVFASSSSVYGGADVVPTPEDAPLRPRSPYAVTKLAGEHYCRVYAELYALETVALRFFNVFGPRQSPRSAYAAVIPLFCRAVLDGVAPTVHGDGRQSRDFTYVGDVVEAVLAAAAAPAARCSGRAFNIAAGRSASLLDVLELLGTLTGTVPAAVHTEPRAGDVYRSQADPSAARRELGVECRTSLRDGLASTLSWLRDAQ
jgi:UDP-glucose 4-epimerase